MINTTQLYKEIVTEKSSKIKMKNKYFTKCTFCGRFMSTKDIQEAKYYDSTSVLDYEPAEPEIVHKKCWEKYKNEKDTKYILERLGRK